MPKLPQPNFDFEVFSEKAEELNAEKNLKQSTTSSKIIKKSKKPNKSAVKSKLKLKKCFIVDMSTEEGYALRLYPKV